MREISPQFRLARLWLRWLLTAWLLTPPLILLFTLLATQVFFLFILPVGAIYIFWPVFLARAAVELAPRRLYVLIVLPALTLLVFILAYGAGAAIAVATWPYQPPSRPLALQLLDLTEIALAHALFIGPFCTAIWLFMPRDKRIPRFYHCVKCNYQLQGSLHAPRCPECGHVLEMGADYPYLPHHLAALENFTAHALETADEDDQA